jgi:hypothetical protein
MKTITCACVVAAALAVGALELSAAGAGRLKFLAAIYLDDKGAGLNVPEGVACDASGQVVVADTGNDRLVRFTYRDGVLAGGGAIKVPQLSSPTRVQLTSKGEILALDGKQRKLARFAANGSFSAAVAFTGVPASETVIVKSFALDSADNIYALDVYAGRVLVLDPKGGFQRQISLPPDAGFPSDLAVDASGTIFAVDSVRRRLLSAARDAAAFSPLGKGEPITTLPTALAAGKGLIFVAESAGSTIAGFGRDGTFLGRQLSMGWEEGSLNYPSQLCVNDREQVFIADRDNNRVQIFQLVR